MSEPYWEPLAAVPTTAMPDPVGQDGKWMKAAGGAAVWEPHPPLTLADIPSKGVAGGLATLGTDGKHNPYEIANRLREYCYTVADANTARSNGWYMGTAIANMYTPNWVVFRVTAHNDIWVTQEAWEFTTGVNSPRWQRRFLGGAWSGWEPEWLQMTQAQYNAATKGPNTLYVIVG